MRRAIIFANGELNISTSLLNKIQPDDLIIAADGGAQHCRQLGITPQVVIGDFDSLQPEDISALQNCAVQMIRYPRNKDETDLELALQYATEQGCQQVLVIGALGARWDMSLANLLLTAHPSFAGLQVRLIDSLQELTLLRGGKSHTLYGSPGDTLSLIPIAAHAEGITTQGLEYPLNDETLYFGSPRGVSNVFSTQCVSVSIRTGLLMCVIIRHGGIP